jgi:hypothetical protein
MATTPYFAYGSNLNVADLIYRAPDAIRDCGARLGGWRLTFRGGANIEPAEGRTVHGALWFVSAGDIRALDRYEGYPSFYRRVFVTVETDEGPREAFTYVMGERYDGYLGLPSANYFETVAQGFRDWGLPLEELDRALREARESHRGRVRSYRPDGPKRLRAVEDKEEAR